MGSDGVAAHATSAELDDLAGALCDAFADDPVQQWLFAGADDEDAARGRFFQFFVEEYFALGHTYVLGGDGTAGGALWSPPDRNVLHDGDRIAVLVEMMTEAVGNEAMTRLPEVARAAEYRPAEPHFYLGILGVSPRRQGEGLGADLVAPVLETCDRTGVIAHLESSNPRNLGFYERLGFRAVDDYRCGGGPLMTIMTRQPG